MTVRELLAERTRVLVEAHRGGDLDASGNSWEALERAHAAGADFIEVDTHLSRDGVAFLRHDYTLGGKLTSTLAWSEIVAAVEPADPPPRLGDVLSWARQRDAVLSLDVKDGFQSHALGPIAELVEQHGLVEQTLILGWDHPSLRRLKERDARFYTRAHVRARLVDLGGTIAAAKADAATLSYDLVTAEDVATLHTLGFAVALGEMWEPNFRFAHELGVDIVSWGAPSEARRELALLSG